MIACLPPSSRLLRQGNHDTVANHCKTRYHHSHGASLLSLPSLLCCASSTSLTSSRSHLPPLLRFLISSSIDHEAIFPSLLHNMTASKGLYHRPTDSLVRQSGVKFYPVDIPIPHPQLRNFISAVDNDWLYYASSYDIYAIHLPTQKTFILITVPFEPRCLAAGQGWICLGGDSNGDCAFVELKGQERSEVDTRLPVNLPAAADDKLSQRARYSNDSQHGPQPNKWRPDLLVQELGGEIVNSITVSTIANQGQSEVNEPVALVSNNDKTVKMYSLPQRKVIADLHHPFPMNYALLSPDSTIMVAVGDGCRAFFYRRKPLKRKHGAIESQSERYPKYEWQLYAIPKLPVGDHMHDDHSFAVTFSGSGLLCGISSQGGMISVFDMDLLNNLDDEDESELALLCMFKSSRPHMWGCIRSMAFSPEPWDLLAWAEDHGRVGIADVRQAFCRRQLLTLDTNADDLERVVAEDITAAEIKKLDVRGRLIEQYRERMAIEHGRPPSPTEYSLLRTDSRSREDERMDGAGATYQRDLDSRERSVLDTLEMTMEEIHGTSQPGSHRQPYSLNYTSSPRVRASLESDPAAIRDRSYVPRRRSSVVLPRTSQHSELAPPSTTQPRLTASPSRIPHTAESDDDADLPPLMSTNDLTPTAGGSSTQPLPYNIPPSDPWHVIQNALEAARGSDERNSSANIARLEQALAEERRLNLTRASVRSSDTTSRSAQQGSAQSSALPTTVRPLDPEIRQHMDNALQQARESLTSNPERRLVTARRTGPPPRDMSTVEHHQRILMMREQTRQRMAAANAASANAAASVAAVGRLGRVERERRSELANRASESDMRLARLMMMSSARQATDRNGNWVAGQALEQLIAASGGRVDSESSGSQSELLREMGVGTAGVAWSPDGQHL